MELTLTPSGTKTAIVVDMNKGRIPTDAELAKFGMGTNRLDLKVLVPYRYGDLLLEFNRAHNDIVVYLVSTQSGRDAGYFVKRGLTNSPEGEWIAASPTFAEAKELALKHANPDIPTPTKL